ncbi:TPA: hypothetical protein EYN98_22340 [Candidatus Poribacteria bacterium]|nr:hypothetical protein [Candidatus Poribacteria bacterium]HIA68728.1 hypothetical protein [Candidatus Poribacteria bacterium]HIB86429.1 hypothetical protein [Candidatus Poribacteria bacterium]HIC03093.1 hypothetical protein [Candidatus Poribacteria bacterium]HIN32283.1 hypothetical protein [Candidatus Poribacteria bacterium]
MRQQNMLKPNQSRIYKIGLMIAVFASLIQIAQGRTFDRIIGFVNDEVITAWEIETLVKQRAMELQRFHNFSKQEARQQAEEDRPQLLDQFIRQMLLVETALTLKIEVTGEEIDRAIQNFKDQTKITSEEEFLNQLKREGFTMISYREQTKRNLMAERLVMQRILPKLQVRDSDVQKFFDENRDQFDKKNDLINLRHIFIAFQPTEVDRQKTIKTLNELIIAVKNGDDFETLAKQIITDKVDKDQIASLVELPISEVNKLSEPFLTALTTLEANKVSNPIESTDGFYVFKIESKSDKDIAFRYLNMPSDISEDSVNIANNTAKTIIEKLNQGEDFSILAQSFSDDTKTKGNGGDLGPNSLDNLTPEIRSIIEKLGKGEYSESVQTLSGVHIFKVDSHLPSELTQAEKDQIRTLLREKKFQDEWKTYTNLLHSIAFVKINK